MDNRRTKRNRTNPKMIEEFYLSRIPGKFNCDGFLSLSKIEDFLAKPGPKNTKL